MSDEAQFGPADVLAWSWLVHARLRLGFAQPIATAMACAPARRPDTPVNRHHPGSLVQHAGWGV